MQGSVQVNNSLWLYETLQVNVWPFGKMYYTSQI